MNLHIMKRFARVPVLLLRTIAILGVYIIVITLFPQQTIETTRSVFKNLFSMIPVILFAVVLTGYLRASGADKLLANAFVGKVGRMLVWAAVFGSITPLCGIEVLPIVSGLLAAGVPLAPVMAFWLSSPVTDPAMLTITAGTIGLQFAIGKTLSAFLIGISGGLVTLSLQASGTLSSPLKQGHRSVLDEIPANTCADRAAVKSTRWMVWKDPDLRAVFVSEAKSVGVLMLTWLTVAFVLESLLTKYLPAELITGLTGIENDWAILTAVAVGIPLYIDGYAALPLVRGLMDLGMSPGSAMAFLVSGGITSIYASVAVFSLVRFSIFLLYIGLAVAGSSLAGYIYQAFTGG